MTKTKVTDAGKETRPRKVVHALFGAYVAKPVLFRASGRYGAVQKAQVLQHGMPKAGANKAGCYREANDDVAGSEVQINGMCRLRGNFSPAYPSSRPRLSEQRTDKSHHALRHLPQSSARWIDNAGLGHAILEAERTAT